MYLKEAKISYDFINLFCFAQVIIFRAIKKIKHLIFTKHLKSPKYVHVVKRVAQSHARFKHARVILMVA